MSATTRSTTARVARTFILAVGLFTIAVPATAAPYRNSAGHGAAWNSGWNDHWNNGSRWPGPNRWSDGAPQQTETVTINVDRYVGSETLPLRQLGGIGPAYAGRTLHSVVVTLNPWGPQAQLQLLVNGQVVDSRPTAGKPRVELRPGQADVFGQGIRTLQLRTVGYASIDDIELNIRRSTGGGGPGGWQPQPQCVAVERQLNMPVRFGELDLGSLFHLQNFNGCRIGSVSFIASTAAGFGQAALRINGTEASNRTRVAASPGLYTLSFWNRPATGPNAPRIALNLMGQFTVQSVRLNLVRD